MPANRAPYQPPPPAMMQQGQTPPPAQLRPGQQAPAAQLRPGQAPAPLNPQEFAGIRPPHLPEYQAPSAPNIGRGGSGTSAGGQSAVNPQARGDAFRNVDKYIDQSFNNAMNRLNPSLEAQKAQFDQQLVNRGIAVGSDAYNKAYRQLDMNQNDARQNAAFQAMGFGTDLQNQMFSQDATRSQLANSLLQAQMQNKLGFAGLGENARQFNSGMDEGARQFDTNADERARQYFGTLREGARQFDNSFGMQDRNFLSQFGEGQRQFDGTFGMQDRNFLSQLGEGQRQFDGTFGMQDRDYLSNFGEDQRRYNTGFAEQARQFDSTQGENARQFDDRSNMAWDSQGFGQMMGLEGLDFRDRQYNDSRNDYNNSLLMAMLGMNQPHNPYYQDPTSAYNAQLGFGASNYGTQMDFLGNILGSPSFPGG